MPASQSLLVDKTEPVLITMYTGIYITPCKCGFNKEGDGFVTKQQNVGVANDISIPK